MRAVLQRVSRAEVTADGEKTGEIGAGLLIRLGVGRGDDEKLARILAGKIAALRIFGDAQGKLNRSALDEKAGMLVISNFTLYGDCRKGHRPDFAKAAPFERARELYECFIRELQEAGAAAVETGRFGADMQVSAVDDGPVTILLDTDEWK